jgi:hypothetical protein
VRDGGGLEESDELRIRGDAVERRQIRRGPGQGRGGCLFPGASL